MTPLASHAYKQFKLRLDGELPKVSGGAGRRSESPYALLMLQKCCPTIEESSWDFLRHVSVSPESPSSPFDFSHFPLNPLALRPAPKALREESEYVSSRGDLLHFGPSVITKPTDKGLMLLCAHYHKKYNIDISVTSSYVTFQEALKAPLYKPGARVWGIIATNGDPVRSHVTPVICFRKDAASPIEILMLDSSETPVLAVRDTLKAIKDENPEALIYEVKGTRQFDNYGCRTDALVVLKDALRILENPAIDHLASFLKLRKDYGPRYSFFLPASWAKTVQVYDVIKDPKSTPILSKHRTLEAFLHAHTPVASTSSISLDLPISKYLSDKGKKLTSKIEAVLLENDKTLKRRFRLLEAFYQGPKEASTDE